MKKTLNLLLTLMLIVISVKNVIAAEDRTEECKNTVLQARPGSFASHSDVTINFYHNAGGSWTHQSNDYTFYQLDGEERKYITYCKSAGACATSDCSNHVSTKKFYCKRSLFNAAGSTSGDAEKSNKAYEKGVIEMLRNGYGDGASKVEYAATVLALRTFEKFWIAEANNGDYDNHRQNKIIKYYADKWLDDSEVKEKIDKIASTLGGSYVRTSKYYMNPRDNAEIESWTSSGGDVTGEVEGAAKSLIMQAFDASIDYLENGAATIAWKAKGAKSKSGDGIKYTHTFKLEKFTSDNASVKAEVVCDDCAKYGVSTSLTVDGSSFSGEMLDYVTDGSGEVKLEVNFTKPSDSYDCEPINYKIKLSYYDDTISAEAYIMQDSSCPTCQEFVLLYADDVEKTQEIDAKAVLCIEESKCTAIIDGAECSDTSDEADFKEGYNTDSGNCGSSDTSGEGDLLSCIVDGIDPAGNSYKATTEEYVDNQFCSVFCKEDYHFVLPGIKEVNSGRYFSLQASIKGKKLCLTNHIDKADTFETQADALRKNVISAWNEWSKWYTGLNGSFEDGAVANKYVAQCSHETKPSSCVNTDVDGDGKADYNIDTNNDGIPDKYIDSSVCPMVTVSCSPATAKGWLRTWNYKKYDFNGNQSLGGQKVEDRDGKAECYEHDEASCPSGSHKLEIDGTQEDVINQIKENLETAITNLNAAIKAYADLINEYNSCFGTKTYKYDMLTLTESATSGWKMGYEFDPKITFWYQESYMNNVLTDKFDTVGTPSVGDFSEIIYASDDKKVPTNPTSDNFKEIGTVLKSKTGFVCYQSGGDKYECSATEKKIQVGTAKYVKQQMKSQGEYITPTQFYTIYPSGGIVVGAPGQEDNIENSDELTNLLPVGLGTTQGVYNYVLRIKDLGEYYDTKELGRIWGSDGSVLVTVLEEAESCSNGGSIASKVDIDGKTLNNGVYVCAYTVNCPDCPVECAPTCKNPVCPENNCPVQCVKCVYTNSSPNTNYRPITPSDINPNDKDIGVNWKWDENGISTGLELKAYVTSTEIEKAGETIYDIDYEDTTQSVNTDFAMKITLDTNMINKIKSYNDQFEGQDGYANNSLKCYDHVNSNDGKKYKNIYCYSTFIDELLYDNKTSDNVKINGNRIIGTDESSSDNLRKTQTQQSGYWTTWSEVNPYNWSITTQNGINYYKQNYQEIGIGPSWK